MGLARNWNINQIPLSIALGNDRALQDKVFAAQQNYMIYPQFGTVNFLSNFNHNTWHSGNFAIEKRYGSGLRLNATFNLSKSLSNDDSLSYYKRAGKSANRLRLSGTSSEVCWSTNCRSARGKKWLNQGGFMNAILGGWKVDVSENINLWDTDHRMHAGSPIPLPDGDARESTATTIEQAKMPELGHGPPVPDGSADALLRYERVRLSGRVHDRVAGIARAAGTGALLDAVFRHQELEASGER